MNEEGLPIIDITEPYTEPESGPRASASSVSGRVPNLSPPTDARSEEEKVRRRAELDRIFASLEEEERMDDERELRKNGIPDEKERQKLELEQKLAQRELQKKMGKALIRNFTQQREQEEQEKAKSCEPSPAPAVAAASSASASAGQTKTVRPKKSVSFSVPDDVDDKPAKPRPKPSLAWGDVSVGSLRSGLPKAKIKAEEACRQPMKMEVVERVPGQALKPDLPERDSDDESDPEVPEEPFDDENEDEENTPPLDGDYDDSEEGSERGDRGSDEEDDFDFSEAAQQREMALNYMRLRGSIGEDAYRATTAHTHEGEGEDEWDQPVCLLFRPFCEVHAQLRSLQEVPLEATLASKPSNHGVSRFKAERAGRLRLGQSTSLGAAVLPGDKASSLQKAVRAGKLTEDSKLVGPVEDSASEGEDAENVERAMEMLKNGVVVEADDRQATADQIPAFSEGSSPSETAEKPPPTSIRPPSIPPTPVSSRPMRPPAPAVNACRSLTQTQTQTQIQTPQAGERGAFLGPRVPPDPAMLSNTIIDSPSFPRPASASAPRREQVQPLVQEVRESTRRTGLGSSARTDGDVGAGAGKRPSRFLAERMGTEAQAEME